MKKHPEKKKLSEWGLAIMAIKVSLFGIGMSMLLTVISNVNIHNSQIIQNIINSILFVCAVIIFWSIGKIKEPKEN